MKFKKVSALFLSAVIAAGISVTAAAEVTPVQTAVVEQVMLSSSEVVKGKTKGGLEYEIENKKVTITGYTGKKSKITLPSKIKGNPVTKIGDSAFYGCTSLTSIKIPKSVTTIGYSAFSGCTSLKSIKIPSSVTAIDDGAFAGCTSLKNITIPKSVTHFGCWAGNSLFEDTPWLKAQQKKNPLVIVNNVLIDATTATGKVTIPKNVKTVLDNAFKDSGVTSITIPSSVETFGDNPCLSLKTIVLPDKSNTADGKLQLKCYGGGGGYFYVVFKYKGKDYTFSELIDNKIVQADILGGKG